ncbi:MAG TPA: hypothetical protein VNZ52_09755 [Candidatus Thermoplasmatota archaeon]|nr:hypothetical protein [Candidatus Thermoplasmatota archaeon]
MRSLVAPLALLMVLALVPATGAQAPTGFEKCGADIVLVFKNPDLQPKPDGFVHASGYFFIQFQAIGERALEIEKFTFSFGKPLPPEARRCDTAEWITGAYLKNYRVDNDPRDGFFVPINTSLVPDGEYGAAVHAYDASGKELVRYYVSAKVDNGGRQSPRDPIAKDTTMPWPMVLPGDGEQTNSVDGLTVEFAEPITFIEARLNGQLLPLSEWTPPARDDDAVPDNPLNANTVTRVWGPGYKWEGRLETDDVLQVRAIDAWGNEAVKVLHLGDPTIGGRIELGFPQLQYVVEAQEKAADATGTATFNFSVKNTGNGSAHGNIVVERTEGLRTSFTQDHVTIKVGETLNTTLRVIAENGLQPGVYDVKGYMEYKRGEQEVREPWAVKFRLNAAQTAAPEDEVVSGTRPKPTVEAPATVAPKAEAPADTPAPGAIVVALGLLGAALVLRRR